MKKDEKSDVILTLGKILKEELIYTRYSGILPLKQLVLMPCQLHDIVLCIIELIPLWLHNCRTFSLEDHRLAKPDFRRRKIKFQIRTNQTIASLKMCITSRQERDRNLAARDDSAGPTNKQTILSPSSLRHVRHNLPIFSLSISFVTINIFML